MLKNGCRWASVRIWFFLPFSNQKCHLLGGGVPLCKDAVHLRSLEYVCIYVYCLPCVLVQAQTFLLEIRGHTIWHRLGLWLCNVGLKKRVEVGGRFFSTTIKRDPPLLTLSMKLHPDIRSLRLSKTVTSLREFHRLPCVLVQAQTFLLEIRGHTIWHPHLINRLAPIEKFHHILPMHSSYLTNIKFWSQKRMRNRT